MDLVKLYWNCCCLKVDLLVPDSSWNGIASRLCCWSWRSSLSFKMPGFPVMLPGSLFPLVCAPQWIKATCWAMLFQCCADVAVKVRTRLQWRRGLYVEREGCMSFVVVFLFVLLLDCCVAVSPFSRLLFSRQEAGRTVSPLRRREQMRVYRFLHMQEQSTLPTVSQISSSVLGFINTYVVLKVPKPNVRRSFSYTKSYTKHSSAYPTTTHPIGTLHISPKKPQYLLDPWPWKCRRTMGLVLHPIILRQF